MTDYKITIHDKHTVGEETSEFTTELIGALSVYKDGNYIISYDEHAGDFAGTTTRIYVKGTDVVRMSRGGDFATELVLEKGKRHNCCYDTPYGSFIMGVYAHDIISEMNLEGGSLAFAYSLDVGGGEVSENELEIKIKEINRQKEIDTDVKDC